MRLIDAQSEKLLNVVLHAISQSVRHGFKPDDREVAEAKSIIDGIETAYDINNVLYKLNELDIKTITRYKNGDFGDYDCVDYYIKKDKAIEIVKQGGVADDVCEWILLNGYNFLHKTS